jgi:hypothetical protein
LRSHLRGKNAGEPLALAGPRCFSSPPSAVAISEQSGAYIQPPQQSEDCSILGDRKQLRGFETERLSHEVLYENSPAFVVPVPLQLLTQSDTWALAQAFSTSRPKCTAHQLFSLGSDLCIGVLSNYASPVTVLPAIRQQKHNLTRRATQI